MPKKKDSGKTPEKHAGEEAGKASGKPADTSEKIEQPGKGAEAAEASGASGGSAASGDNAGNGGNAASGGKAGGGKANPLLAAIPEVLWLLGQSPTHKYLFIADLEWYFLPALRLRQFRIFHHEKAPVAYVSWALVSDEVQERFKTGNMKLRPADWNSGDNLWLVDMVAPFGGQEELLKKLKDLIPGNKPIKTVVRGPDGEMKVVEV